MAKKYNTPLADAASNNPYLVTDSYIVNSPLRNNQPSYMTQNPTTTPAQQHLPNFSSRQNLPPSFDYTQLNQMIENTLTRLLNNFNIVPNNNQPASQNNVNNDQSVLQQNFQNPSSNNVSINPANNLLRDEPFARRTEKIISIFQSWNLKFDGSANGLNVEEFLYRVRSLTTENFNGDFNVICKNLNILLVGKARDWYWRYHKEVTNIDWKEFCEALKYQYKDFRNRKMKPGEKFETFYESICTMLDRLETPFPESELVEILTRNLRSDIRHELLYVPIYSVAHLRKLVQMRENLLGNEYFRKNLPPKQTPQLYNSRNVAELDVPSATQEAIVDAIKTGPITTNCWNCGENGHHWEDCLKERKVFCYGCGASNTYKPQCLRCCNRKLTHSKNLI